MGSPSKATVARLQPRHGRRYRFVRLDGGRHAFEEGEVAYLVRAKLDLVAEVLAHRQRQYARNLARWKRMIVSGLTIANA
jgi:hypothetical protein